MPGRNIKILKTVPVALTFSTHNRHPLEAVNELLVEITIALLIWHILQALVFFNVEECAEGQDTEGTARC